MTDPNITPQSVPDAVPQPAVVQRPEETKELPKIDAAELPGMKFEDEKSQNVTPSRATVSPGTVNVNETCMFPSASSAYHEALSRGFPSLRQLSSAEDRRWGATYLNSLWTNPADNALQSSLSREGSDWRQGVHVNGELLRSQVPHYQAPVNKIVTGEQALTLAYAHMEMGDIFHAGMWNSGFWVTFKPAPEPVWLNINRLLGADVTRLCRDTYGLLHSTATSLTVSTIIDAILPFVYATSVNPGEMAINDIPQHLKASDELDFIWGFICANYPRGFNIERSCLADPSKCRTVISEVIHPQELQWVDNAALPEFCRSHMRNRGAGKMSLANVKEYQERLDAHLGQVITIGKNRTTELTLSSPTSHQKRIMTEAYVEGIKSSVLSSVTDDVPMSQRESMYQEHMAATEMRMYQHWVSKIVFDSITVDKPEDIANILGIWTRDNDLRVQFFEEMAKFLDKTSVSVLALQAVVCPNCGADHSSPTQIGLGKIDCVPIDIIQVFSLLAEFKTRVISARA
jgi:hypothetical protein